jgi:hypothetical protein
MDFAFNKAMMKSIAIWIILCSSWVSLHITPGVCFAATPSGNEAYAIALVNYIRQNPAVYAEALGYNGKTLLKTQSWTPFSLSEFLNLRATALNCLDQKVQEPMPTYYTDYVFTGDIGGVVSFVNYMDPVMAVNIIVNSQFNKELDPLYEGKKYILSSDYDLIGVSFKVGTTQVKTGLRNAYYISLCFGSSLLKSEVQVVNLINQFRADPSNFKSYLPVDKLKYTSVLRPLFISDPLGLTAKTGLTALIDFPAYAAYFGFSGTGVMESSIVEVFPETDPDSYSLWIFSALMLGELKSYPAKQSILNPIHNSIGTGIYYLTNSGYIFSKLTVASGVAPAQPAPSDARIYGIVFTDKDENGSYAPGEEAPDKTVIAYDQLTLEKKAVAVTNNAGQFVMNLPANAAYMIQTGTEKNLSAKKIDLSGDCFFDLVLQPEKESAE